MSISAMNKFKLCFDPNKPDKGDNVGSFVRAGTDGDLISSRDISGSEHLDVFAALAAGDGTPITQTGGALDVNLASPVELTVDLDGIYNAGTNADPDNVGIIAHSRSAAPGDAEQVERTTAANPDSDNIDPANVNALDSNSFLMGWDGTNWDRISATGGKLDVNAEITQAPGDCFEIEGCIDDDAADSGKPVKIGHRALSTLSSVDDGDRADSVSDLYRRMYINQSANIAGTNGAVAIDDTVGGTAIVSSALDSRKHIMVQNLGDSEVYLGFGTVTAANGIQLPPCAIAQLDIGPNLALKAIAASGETEDVRYMELG